MKTSLFYQLLKQQVLINPKSPSHLQKQRQELMRFDLKEHVWLTTSGSCGKKKWVALSKEALFISAASVNQWIGSDQRDVWLLALPTFHVGGLGIVARAELSGASLVLFEGKWDPVSFVSQVEEKKVTLTSLVPTQVFDLVTLGCVSPPSLRAVFVGGGALSSVLLKEAKQLNWPLFPSYGLTECSSQVATGEPLERLSHVELRVSKEGFLKIKSPSLFSGYVIEGEWIDPKVEGWFETEDKVILQDQNMTVLGRGKDFIKINGENVSLAFLQNVVQELLFIKKCPFEVALYPVQNPRSGFQLEMRATAKDVQEMSAFLQAYHEKVFPFERITNVHLVKHLPKSPLGKVLLSKIK